MQSNFKLEAKDVLQNINRMQADERAENAGSSPWWPWPLICLSEGQNVFCMNLVQIHSAVPEIFHMQNKKKTREWQRQKENLPQCKDKVYSQNLLILLVHQ